MNTIQVLFDIIYPLECWFNPVWEKIPGGLYGVYIFFEIDEESKNCRALYVGHSNRMRRRIKEHLKGWSELYDIMDYTNVEHIYLGIKLGAMKRVEEEYIQMLNPVYNIMHKDRWAGTRAFRALTRFTGEEPPGWI